MSYSYKLKSHPHQSLYTHLTQVTEIAMKTHKSHSDNDAINKFIEITCMCHDFGKGTTYFQRYLKGEYNGVEKQHGIISAIFAYWMLPNKWKHLGFFIIKKHHGNIDNGNDECKKDDVLWRLINKLKI